MSQLKRLRDWQSRLDRCIRERRLMPFAWGSNDCALFAAACVDAVVGQDLAADLRGYSSEAEAQQIIEAHGGLEAIVTARLGEPVAPMLARVGDVGLVAVQTGECLAVCGGYHWHAPGPNRMMTLPLDAARVAWRVG
jgi:hypothetical protein